jgi:hypothetical protein
MKQTSNEIENMKYMKYTDTTGKAMRLVSFQQFNTTILKTERSERDKTKQCNYCKGKGWRGIGHTDEECFTKKREMANEKEIKKANNSDDENSEAYIYNTASNENEGISKERT